MEKCSLKYNTGSMIRFWLNFFIFIYVAISLSAQENSVTQPQDSIIASDEEIIDTSSLTADATSGENLDEKAHISGDHGESSGHGNEYDIKRGERLFHGLVRIKGEDGVNCAGCHNTRYIDTLNWNPSAYEIALTSADMDSTDFAEVLLDPFGTARLEEAHVGIRLPPEDIELVQLYLKHVKETGIEGKKPTINKLLKFIGLLIIVIVVLVDLTTKKILKFKAVHLTVILVATYFIIEMVAQEAIALGRSEGYAPLQPVKFSHQVHAGQNKTDCLYCHHTAEQSKSAGIPSVSLCMNCHLVVREGSRSGAFEINKIWEAMNDSISIEWTRVHRLPDHVFFSHAQHVKAGQLDCQECHGPVEEMHVLKQHSDLSMGWCLDCHRTRSVQFLENDYYETYEEFHESIKNGEIDSVTVANLGGAECMKCHY
jgi:hypothetical protein